jgi:hypothetical protein
MLATFVFTVDEGDSVATIAVTTTNPMLETFVVHAVMKDLRSKLLQVQQ